jgi:hypothetical protein
MFPNMLKFSKNYFFQIQKYIYCEGKNSEYLGIFHFFEMKISKLINYFSDGTCVEMAKVTHLVTVQIHGRKKGLKRGFK